MRGAAAAAGVEVLKPAQARAIPASWQRLREIGPDCCAVTAYGALIPQAALDIPRHGWVNLHFSLLPAWRGAAPVQHAIMHGDDITGATTFRLVAELDAGPVFGVLTEPVRPGDTAGDLLARLAVSGAGLLVATMDGIESGELDGTAAAAGRDQPRAQGHDGRRADRLEPAAIGDRPADPRVHPAARGVDGAGRRPAQGLAAGRRRAEDHGVSARARASCAWTAPGHRSARAPGRCCSATSSRTANGGCRPPTGPGACAGCRQPGPG